MTDDQRLLHLNAFLMAPGHHDAAWRHPASRPERATDVTYFQELARTAERGRLDSIFFADGLAVWHRIGSNVSGGLEPLTLLSAIAVATRHIGLISTASTTFNEPFTLARLIEVAKKLWDSWDDDAVLLDTATGRYADTAKDLFVAPEAE
ncbi:LLM class flavin-dependent oxidoreductase [Spirillospora sp. CA-142024]|uniref:LLM class flavin-dependent oxidoreductase n=1 Tax=Spirillospora sp. CA-142024 TaxID=3240036 RepID=UPI003D8B408B